MSVLIHSPDRFITLPFRRCEKNIPDWGLCAKYIATNHSSNNTTALKNTIKNMMECHNIISKNCTLEMKTPLTENFISHTLKPYCKLIVMAQAHLPLHSGKVSKSLKFFWRDSFKEGLKYDTYNSNVELVSCIYNMAATYVHIAAQQAQQGTIESIKEAFQNYQSAAGYYTMVKDLLFRVPPEYRSKGDLGQDSLELLIKICLAEAHHCGYLKAEEAMKDNQEMLAKIAREGAKMFTEVHTLMVTSIWFQEKSHLAKKMEVLMSVNACIFEVRACLHMGLKNERDVKVGVAIGYYAKALRFLDKLPKISSNSMSAWADSVAKSAKAAHEKAQNMNATVYYERVSKEVPDVEGLPRPLGCVAKHNSFVNAAFMRESDPFFGIVPVHISNAAMQWRDKERRRVVACENDAAQNCVSARNKMQKLGVMSIIQTLSGDAKDYQHIPEPLRSKILGLHSGGEKQVESVTQNILDTVNTCKELQAVLCGKLHEIVEVLDEEKKLDDKLLDSYGEKMWRASYPAREQTPEYNSIMAAYEMHKQNFDKYVSDRLVVGMHTLDQNLRDIARLDWKISDLDSLMPYAETKDVHEQSVKVKKCIDSLKQVVADFEATEKDQKDAQYALNELLESDAIVVGLSAVESAQQSIILERESRSITDAIAKVSSITRKLPEMVEQAEKLIEELSTLQSINPLAQEIQKVTNSLENAYNLYTELLIDFTNISQYASKNMNEVEATLSTAESFRTYRQLQSHEVQARLDVQIQAKMNELKTIESELFSSRKRQEEIRAQMQQLQSSAPSEQQSQVVPQPPSSMPFNPYGYPVANNLLPPQPQLQPHPQTMYYQPQVGDQKGFVDPPPDYNSLINNTVSAPSLYDAPPSIYGFPSAPGLPMSQCTPNFGGNAASNSPQGLQPHPYGHFYS